jgi:hypothetical protein
MIAPARGTRSPLLLLSVGIAVAALVSFTGLGPLRSLLDIARIEGVANPYWIPGLAFQMWVVGPAVTLFMALLFMGPGLLIGLSTGRDKSAAVWLLASLGWSIALFFAVTLALRFGFNLVPKGSGFLWVALALNLAALVLAALLVAARGGAALRPGADWTDLGVGLALGWVVLAALAPKFYWENFTPDGSGALQFARLHINAIWPFWPDAAGVIRQAPGLTSVLFVFPESWFVRAIGETEYSVRAPYALYVAVLYPVLLGLVRQGRDAAIGWPAHLLICGAIMVYTLTIIYSGGYLPRFNDSPMPAVRETLAIALFLGYCLAFLEDRRALMLATGIMAHLTIPTGGLWLLLWPLAVALVWRPVPWTRLRFAALVLGVAAAITVLGPVAIRTLGLPFPGGEFDLSSIVQRLRYVAVADWNRFAFLIVPAGIVPALCLVIWRWQDATSRALTLATLAFFLFFYLQAYRVLLHHFAPVMLVPLVIFWRSVAPRFPLPAAGLAAIGLAAALWLAWPREMGLHTFDREIGAQLSAEGPLFDGERGDGDRFRRFDPAALDVMHTLAGDLFPIGYTDEAARTTFFGGPLVWWYYSEFPKSEGQVTNYRVLPEALAAEAGGTVLGTYGGYALVVRDLALYERHRTTQLPVDTGAPIFVTGRDQIFGRGAQWGERIVIDLVAVARAVIPGI